MTTESKGPTSPPWVPSETSEKTMPTEEIAKKAGPSFWLGKLRPKVTVGSLHHERVTQAKFDSLFAGAKANARWEDDWPLMTEEEFSTSLKAVSNIEFGGHHPDGSHPRAGKE